MARGVIIALFYNNFNVFDNSDSVKVLAIFSFDFYRVLQFRFCTMYAICIAALRPFYDPIRVLGVLVENCCAMAIASDNGH